MSSKTLASALLSYGADLRVTNMVLEIIFSILPILWSSEYKLLDFKDELVVDLLFQYVRTILVDRDYYGDMMVPLLEEQFRDLDLESLTQTEVSLLCGVALKRLVSQAVHAAGKVFSPQYDDAGNILQPTSAMSGEPQKNFLNEMMKKYLIVERGDALSFIKGKFTKSKAELGPVRRVTTNKWTSETKKIGAAIVIEPYVSLTLKSKKDIIECLEELVGEYDVTVLNTYLNGVAFLVEGLTGTGAQDFGDYIYAKKSNIADTISENTNLDYIDGKTLFSSPQDLESQYKLHLFDVYTSFLKGQGDAQGGSFDLSRVLDYIFVKGTLSMRATVQQPSLPSNLGALTQATNFKLKSQTTPEGFARDFYKLLYYEDSKGAGFKTIQVATVDKEYAANDLFGRALNAEETKKVVDAQYYQAQAIEKLKGLTKSLADAQASVNYWKKSTTNAKDALAKQLDDLEHAKASEKGAIKSVLQSYKDAVTTNEANLAVAQKTGQSIPALIEQQQAVIKTLSASYGSYLEDLKGALGAVTVPFIKETMHSWWSMENLMWAANNKSESSLTLGERLFVNLLSTPEFDALTKSLLAPLTVFNAIQLIPSIEIGSAMREMMRSQGIFKGLDEILDSYFLDLQGYLTGFPFEGCGDWSGIV